MKKISRRSFLTAMAAVSAAGVLTACGASSSTASSVASSVAASSEAATSSEAVPESVTIKAFNGAKELVDVEVPFDPQRIAILELASLDSRGSGTSEDILSEGRSAEYHRSFCGRLWSCLCSGGCSF